MLSFINAGLALRSSGYPLHPPPPVRTTAVRPAPAAVEQAAALASISAAALGGAAISDTLTPSSFDMLASAGLFNEDVLYTDWMMDKIDALSPACWLVAAALVAGNFAAPLMVAKPGSPSPWRKASPAAGEATPDPLEEAWACVRDEVQGFVCGATSFDSSEDGDGLICIDVDGRWVCA